MTIAEQHKAWIEFRLWLEYQAQRDQAHQSKK
jgi:hypothetical protein